MFINKYDELQALNLLLQDSELWQGSRTQKLVFDQINSILRTLQIQIRRLSNQGAERSPLRGQTQMREKFQVEQLQFLKKTNVHLTVRTQNLQSQVARLANLPILLTEMVEHDALSYQQFKAQFQISLQQSLNGYNSLSAQVKQFSEKRLLVQNSLRTQIQEHMKRLTLVEHHCRMIENQKLQQVEKLTKSYQLCQAGLQRINEHIQAGARLNRIESKLREGQSELRGQQVSMFDELRALVNKIGGEIDDLRRTKLQREQFIESQSMGQHEKRLQYYQNLQQAILIQSQRINAQHSILREDLEKSLDVMRSDLGKLTRILVNKPSSQQIQYLSSEKCDKKDFEILSLQVLRLRDQKLDLKQFKTRMIQQKEVNQSIFKQNILAKWLWNTEATRTGLVPWNIQVVNTRPQIFQWQRTSSSIRISCAGIYQISACFFTTKKPIISVLVDGRPVPVSASGPSYVVQHSGGRMKENKHPSGEVTGLSLNDYLLLQQNSQISIKYEGTPGQAFLLLRRV